MSPSFPPKLVPVEKRVVVIFLCVQSPCWVRLELDDRAIEKVDTADVEGAMFLIKVVRESIAGTFGRLVQVLLLFVCLSVYLLRYPEHTRLMLCYPANPTTLWHGMQLNKLPTSRGVSEVVAPLGDRRRHAEVHHGNS